MLDRATCEMLAKAGLDQTVRLGDLFYNEGNRVVAWDDNPIKLPALFRKCEPVKIPSSDELEAFARTLAEKLSGASPLDIRIRVDTWCNGSRASVNIRHAFGYLISYGGLVESAFLPDRSAALVALIRKLVEIKQ